MKILYAETVSDKPRMGTMNHIIVNESPNSLLIAPPCIDLTLLFIIGYNLYVFFSYIVFTLYYNITILNLVRKCTEDYQVKSNELADAHFAFSICLRAFSLIRLTLRQLVEIKNELVHLVA